MILKLKLKNAKYEMHIDGSAMTVEVKVMSGGKDGKPVREMTSNLGYYGPAQVDHAINRIIAHETTLQDEEVGLKRFLEIYREIHNIVLCEVTELKEAVKQRREEER